MGTVTYLPYKDKIFVTCNHDSRPVPEGIQVPTIDKLSSGKVLYPKNNSDGGTWVGIHNNGNAMVMIEGAFSPHITKDEYRMTLGEAFLLIFNSKNPVKHFTDVNLDDVEPFTIIVWLRKSGTLWEMRWDEYEKFVKSLPADIPNMWSSATLFDEDMINKRKKWFDEWRLSQDIITGENIRDFHENGGEGYERLNLSLNKGAMHTLSITSIEISEDRSVMYYHDLVTGEQTINGWLFAEEEDNS